MRSLLDEGISKPLDGSVSIHARGIATTFPTVPCRLQNLHIYEVTVRCRGEKLVFISSIFAFTVPLMLPCKALGPPNNHATGHDGQIDIENYKSKILEVKQL